MGEGGGKGNGRGTGGRSITGEPIFPKRVSLRISNTHPPFPSPAVVAAVHVSRLLLDIKREPSSAQYRSIEQSYSIAMLSMFDAFGAFVQYLHKKTRKCQWLEGKKKTRSIQFIESWIFRRNKAFDARCRTLLPLDSSCAARLNLPPTLRSPVASSRPFRPRVLLLSRRCRLCRTGTRLLTRTGTRYYAEPEPAIDPNRNTLLSRTGTTKRQGAQFFNDKVRDCETAI